jgi:hypothetical protein
MLRTYEETLDYIAKNAHRFSPDQRTKMIAECVPGFLALIQYEQELEKKSATTRQ